MIRECQPEKFAGKWVPSIMGVNQIRSSIPFAPELALDEGTRGRQIERVRFVQHPCAREKITILSITWTSHLQRKKKQGEEQKEETTLPHFSLSSLCIENDTRREKTRHKGGNAEWIRRGFSFCLSLSLLRICVVLRTELSLWIYTIVAACVYTTLWRERDLFYFFVLCFFRKKFRNWLLLTNNRAMKGNWGSLWDCVLLVEVKLDFHDALHSSLRVKWCHI